MPDFFGSKFNRRGVLKSSMAVLGGSLLSRYSLEKAAAQTEPAIKTSTRTPARRHSRLPTCATRLL